MLQNSGHEVVCPWQQKDLVVPRDFTVKFNGIKCKIMHSANRNLNYNSPVITCKSVIPLSVKEMLKVLWLILSRKEQNSIQTPGHPFGQPTLAGSNSLAFNIDPHHSHLPSHTSLASYNQSPSYTTWVLKDFLSSHIFDF